MPLINPMKKIPKKVIWFTGLSGSGKSTLANSLISQLRKQKFSCILLDGDEVRSGLCADLAFSENDRIENIRRIAEMASLLLKQNDFVVYQKQYQKIYQYNLTLEFGSVKRFRTQG